VSVSPPPQRRRSSASQGRALGHGAQFGQRILGTTEHRLDLHEADAVIEVPDPSETSPRRGVGSARAGREVIVACQAQAQVAVRDKIVKRGVGGLKAGQVGGQLYGVAADALGVSGRAVG
jgi:hypothetical protein